MTGVILLIDDDTSLLRVTEYNLMHAGFKVACASSGKEGLEKFEKLDPALIVTDVKLGDMSGLDILQHIKKVGPDVPVIVITAFGSIEMAVKAMNMGAFNFITKPFDRDTLRRSCEKAIELRSLRAQTKDLSEEINKLTGTQGMETANSAMAELLETALRVANSEATVLITGESGTGKEVLARLIHQNSPRNKQPFVAFNCAAIPPTLIESELFGHVKGAFTGAVKNRKGRFQTAGEGSIFLDEIGELQVEMQAKLLRVIQEREVEPVGADASEPVNARMIAATNIDLPEAISKGSFREDLFYRLSVIPLHIPPLRERKEDIPGLVGHFLQKLGAPATVQFSKKAMAELQHYDWPGNIRELQNSVERCVILRKGDVIDKTGIRPTASPKGEGFSVPEIPEAGISLEEVEKSLIQKALLMSKGNRSEAARLLKIPRHVLIYRLEKFGIE
nr:sigma-54-dependent Fis family transcriptional regulator [Desulfobulbaceae bacterium]